jgi:hypothetical protein
MMFIPHRKHRLPRLLMGIAVLFYMYMMFLPHRKHAYGPPQSVTRIVLHLQADNLTDICELLV